MEIEKTWSLSITYDSAGFNWFENTHIAFVPAPGETAEVG